MANTEKVQLQDPLTVIDTFHKQHADYRNFRLRATAALLGANSLWFITPFTGRPEAVIATTALAVGAAVYYVQGNFRHTFEQVRGKLINNHQLKEAYALVKTVGEPPVDNCELEEFCRYGLAQRVRATKLFLAQQGRLNEYQEFNWLQTIPVPENLMPTHTEIDEVDRWRQKQDTRLANFVDELSRQQKVFIECGQGILAEAIKVYLFEDPQDPWKNKSEPLLDTMLALKARKKDLQPISIDNALAFLHDPNRYNGIFSSEGRQRIVDFFGKPVDFYSGSETMRTEVNRYGVWEDIIVTINSLPEHLWRRSIGRPEPFSYIESVETTRTRLEKIGLTLAKA